MHIALKRKYHSKLLAKRDLSRAVMYTRVSSDNLSKLAKISMESVFNSPLQKVTFTEID